MIAIPNHSKPFRVFSVGMPTQNVLWNHVGGITDGGDGTATATAGFGNASGTGSPELENSGTGLRGFIEFGHNATSDYGYCGFSSTNSGTAAAQNFGFSHEQLAWAVWINGANTSLPSGNSATTDRYRVELYDDRVEWLVNGVVVHTLNTVAPAATYYPAVAMYYTGAAFTNVIIAGQTLTPR